MATLVLSAAGAAIGSGFGGTVLGLSGAVIGRAIGATLGRAIDQRILGGGSEAVEIGRVERFRLMGASEGGAVAEVFGRMRVAGQVIWATRFLENSATSSSGGKGAPGGRATTYSYSVSLAIALCIGEINGIGRIWADGAEIAPGDLNLRLYTGTDSQLPDPKIEAVEGADQAPAYRGIAYVVIEDLDLGRFGNRVPQFSFEVVREAQGALADKVTNLQQTIRGVALIPGTGEYALATTKVHYGGQWKEQRVANTSSARGVTDFAASLDQLTVELPNCRSVSLVVSWFGNELRAGRCQIRPKVEQTYEEGEGLSWRAGGISRPYAQTVPQVDGAPVYGGTPADDAVIEGIRALRDAGREVMFYPFILMEQLADNGLADPWTGAADQPVLPWRGRITLDQAPGREGSSDGTHAAVAEVEAFFGTAQPGDFFVEDGVIRYAGSDEWGYRRFILHYAHLCALAGGVEAFCIGSELVSLTQIRGPGHSFPAVNALRALAADVRAILGPQTRISYAADWSEYFGYHKDGNVYFHLDPLWADPNIDFIGIDNYMPLSDWRDGERHQDAAWGSIYNLDYLKANVAGGEGYDWYYDSDEGAAAQYRKPITDGAHGEPWVFRYKDIRGWWSNLHHNRINGTRQAEPTGWVPRSKPIWFTEYGCAAIDKGANQPNKFLDPKSSESTLPRFSDGRRDDLMQMQYLIAMHDYWTDAANNPVSPVYEKPMVDWAHAHAWAWDARPFPVFPGRADLWSDGGNYARGHWLTGRASSQPLAAVVSELCERAGVTTIDVSGLHGVVRGYIAEQIGTPRAALQSLMLSHGFDAIDRDGVLRFRMRSGTRDQVIDGEALARTAELDAPVQFTRQSEAELVGQVVVGHFDAEADFEMRQSEARFPDDAVVGISQTDLPLTLTPSEGAAIAERWLAESRISRDTARFALPRSMAHLGAGDVVELSGQRWRIDRVEQAEALLVDAVRTEAAVYVPAVYTEDPPEVRSVPPQFPVMPVFMDLPLLAEDDAPHAPYLAVSARPWRGPVVVWSADFDFGYAPNVTAYAPATVGITETALAAAAAGRWDRSSRLRLRLRSGALSSASEGTVLNGANSVAIGNPETGQWEVLQYAKAELVAHRTYEVSMLLRGQLGTDGVMPASWPEGSVVVLLDRSLLQVQMPSSARGLTRNYRVAPANVSITDAEAQQFELAFDGNGLRPYAPVHLRAAPSGGGVQITWIRRTRIDGDSWASTEVPLGEEVESYLVKVRQGQKVLQNVTVSSPQWHYSAAEMEDDGASGDVVIEVSQVSARFGPGPAARLELAL